VYRLLIVEDERMVRRGLAQHHPWADWGFTVCAEAESGYEALQRLASTAPHAMLTDIRMPDMNGLELMRTLSQRQVACPTVIVSGYGDFEYARQAIAYGAVAYLLKPVKQEELCEAFRKVRGLLERTSAQPGQAAFPPRNLVLEPALHYVHAHFARPISAQDLARMSNLSLSQFNRLFRAETGAGVVDYVNRVRVEKAMQLLSEPSCWVYEVADRVGFDDARYFARVFRSITGMSPTEYKEQLHAQVR